MELNGMMRALCCAAAFLGVGLERAQGEVVTAPVPLQMYYRCHNDNFTVRVRPVGEKEWTDLYEYNVKVDMDTQSDATMVQFDFSGEVEVMVQLNNGTLTHADIRPLSRGIQHKIVDNAVLFTLDRPQKLSVECNGDRLHNLHLFANPLETDAPKEGTPGVMYFAPGVHEPEDKEARVFKVPSNTTVYLAPGAVLYGSLNCDSIENVRICGRGMIWEAPYGISACWAKNVVIEDIAVVDPRYNSVMVAQSSDVSVRGVKSFSHQGWSDGMDFYCSKRISVDDVFMRNSDDCVAIYSHRWNFYGDTDDIKVTNSTLWADIAHPINIGTHGNAETEGETIENILFRNIDVLEHDEDDRDYQGVMTVNAGERNWIRNVTFDSIRVEHIQEGQLFHLRVMNLPKYCAAPGRNVEHIVFSNITYTGYGENLSVVKGYSAEGMVRDVLFDNIVINGERARKLEDLGLKVGDFTEGIQLK